MKYLVLIAALATSKSSLLTSMACYDSGCCYKPRNFDTTTDDDGATFAPAAVSMDTVFRSDSIARATIRPSFRGRLRCQEENGTVPYWLDKSCRSYLSCVSFNLSLQVCGRDQAYSFGDKSCRPTNEVNCSEQNREFTSVIRTYLAPHFYKNLPLPTRLPLIPFSASYGGNTFRQQLLAAGRENVVDDDKEEEEALEEDMEDFARDHMTIDLDDLPSIIVDSTNAVNITLPEENCIRLGSQVKQLETSMNQALLMLVGCPEHSCDVTLFRVNC